MMKKYYISFVLGFIALSIFSQGYEFGIVHISDYDFKIVAIPNFDSAGNTDVSDVGFSLMLPAGSADVTSISSVLGGKTPTLNEVPAAALDGLALGDGTRDLFFLQLSSVPSAIFSHTDEQLIDLVSFQVSNMPVTGEMSILPNDDPIAIGLAGSVDSFYNSNIDATTTQDYFTGLAAGMELIMFSTLSDEDFELLNHLTVYPNPASDYLNIESSLDLKSVELYDISGKKVLSSLETEQINVKTISAGLYFLNVFATDGKKAIKKIIIER
jgi:hypothetical protein